MMHSILKLTLIIISFAIAFAPTNHNLLSEPVQLPAFDLEGHRGARGLMPENTIPAMIKALELGVTTLEMDAHVTKNGKVVLSHDPYINPDYILTPEGKEIPKEKEHAYVLYNMNYSDIRKFDAGSKFYSKYPQQHKVKTYKPLLSEVIDSAQTYIQEHNLKQVFYNIETKSKPFTDGKYHPAPEEFVQRIMDVVDQKGIRPWVIIQSFDVRTLQMLHNKYPDVKTALLVENFKSLESNLQKLGFTPTIYSPYYKLVTADLVKSCHSRGIKVIPWTVNDLDDMKHLKQLGVNGLISDYPNLYKQL